MRYLNLLFLACIYTIFCCDCRRGSKDPGFWTKTSLLQLGYGIWANMAMVVIGLNFGFSAVTVPQLTSPESPILVTISDESWIASVLSLVSPIGCVISGYLMDRFGRRFMLIYSQVGVIVGWFYTGYAATAKDIIIGRIITGIGMGMIMGVPRVYTTEISLPNMRGVSGSFPNLAMSLGITAQAGLGSTFKWTTLCFISGGYSVTLFFCYFLIPETPYFLLKTSTIEKAAESLRKFRGRDYNIDAEIEELIDFKMENDIRKLTFKEQIGKLFQRSSCVPLWTIMTYILITQLSGCTVLIMWTIEFIERSRSSVSPELGNIVLGVARVLSGIGTSILIFRTGRKPLALISGLGVGVICVFLGIFIQVKTTPTVLPILCYVGYILFATVGHYTLPVLIMFELYPLQVRGVLGGISVSGISIMIFGANKCYPYLRNWIGFENTVISFGVFSLLGCIFLYYFLPETKDLTLQEIEEFYNQLRPTLTSQRRLVSMQNLQTLSREGNSSRLLKDIDKQKNRSNGNIIKRSESTHKN